MKSHLHPNGIIENHPIHYTLLFDWILESIPDIFSAINSKKIKRKYLSISGIPELKSWLKLYKKSKKIMCSIFENFVESNSEFDCIMSLLYVNLCIPCDEQKRIIDNENIKYESLSEFDKKLYMAEKRLFYKNLKAESDRILNDNSKSNSEDNEQYNLSKIEYIFFINVIMPCLVHYGELPSSLLRRARLGDIDALKKIIQVDKSCIYDNNISKLLHNLSLTNIVKYNSVCRVLLKNNKNISMSKLKERFAALLSKVSMLYGKILTNKPLTAEQIRFRFDAHAKSRGLGEIDVNLPSGPHAFYMWTYRNRNFWKIFERPYRN